MDTMARARSQTAHRKHGDALKDQVTALEIICVAMIHAMVAHLPESEKFLLVCIDHCLGRDAPNLSGGTKEVMTRIRTAFALSEFRELIH